MAFTIKFLIAPSKEGHPLIGRLLHSLDRMGKTHVFCLSRVDGFLMGMFEISALEEDEVFSSIYVKICDLGYVSEYHGYDQSRDDISYWISSSYPKYEEAVKATRQKREWDDRNLFWQRFPHLMAMMEYGHPLEA